MAVNISTSTEALDNNERSTPITTQSPGEINVFFAIFLPFISVMIIISNAAVIVAFNKVPFLALKPRDLLILNLTVSDFVTGWVLLILITPYFIIGYWPYGEVGCMFAVCLTVFILSVSLSTLCAISVDRVKLVATEYTRYVQWQSLNRIKTIIVICWTMSFIPVILELSLWKLAKLISIEASLLNFKNTCMSPGRFIIPFSLFIFLAFSLIPFVVIGTSSAIFVFFFRKQLKKRQRISTSEVTTRIARQIPRLEPNVIPIESFRMKDRYMKPAITLAVLVFGMGVCMTPYCVYIIVGAICPTCVADIDSNSRFSFLLLMYVNSLLNPLLYSMTQRRISRFYKTKLRHFYIHCTQ